MFCLQIQYFSNNIRINSILFECSELKSDTFRVFRVEIPYFLNVWAKKTHFWNSLVSNTISMNFLLYNHDIFQTFCICNQYFSNVLSRNQILFESFGAKITLFSNVLCNLSNLQIRGGNAVFRQCVSSGRKTAFFLVFQPLLQHLKLSIFIKVSLLKISVGKP